jgi:hypothetical protein
MHFTAQSLIDDVDYQIYHIGHFERNAAVKTHAIKELNESVHS